MLLNIQCQIMCNKEGNIFKKTISLKNYYKNSLNNINNDFNIK